VCSCAPETLLFVVVVNPQNLAFGGLVVVCELRLVVIAISLESPLMPVVVQDFFLSLHSLQVLQVRFEMEIPTNLCLA
jgi:hypothetical protein